MPNTEPILVTGATGGQGGAVTRALLARGRRVRALVRTPDSPAAKELRALGAEPVTGDLDDPRSLRAAAQGAYGVFSVQPADFTDPRPDIEVRRGRNVADAAAAAGAAHLVYSSVGPARRGTGVAHFESKAEIETYIEALGVPATVLRPVYFMENWQYLLPEPDGNGERVCPVALAPDTPLQMIALADIGRIAADAFADPAAFLGRTVEIAGDELTVRQIAEVFARVQGIPTRFEQRPDGVPEFAKMYDWINKHGYTADLPTLRERHPGLLTLETWLNQNPA
ncbi:NmrA/HSCARG family protein [Streptomyces sp. TRM68416]|uniref:NmrA/HSCARG family protein n=1 Tax=Streptomyces sp. TRM68416 TaxID=2758412 RepID=UPI0016619A05|nr:NmrA/HSCARG family protein [Streptomyces sp. TRM68416]MBD0844095.1 NmrA/HSCARG family protein [Streptomyces sp. TRM68416]